MATTGTKMAIHAAAKAAGIPNYKKMPLGKLIPLLPDDVQQILKLGKFGVDKMRAYGGKAKKKMMGGGKVHKKMYAMGGGIRKAKTYG